MAVRAKELRFETTIDADGELSAEGCEALELGETWTAEHLLLAALSRCSLASLAYAAKRDGRTATGSGRARGVVTRRDDGRYAFVEIDAELDVELQPAPPDDELAELLAKAEHGCFIAASLTVKPHYRWRVNGVDAPFTTPEVPSSAPAP